MAQFTNQATLSYGDTVTTSNIALGEVLEVLSATKTAVNGVYYGQNDTITYIISLINSGAVPLNNLTVTDNLGTFDFGTGTLTPLVYTTGSVKYYQNGVISPSPSVTTSESQVVFSGISVPANGNSTLAYEVTVNNLAPLDEGAEITNVATINGGGVTPISASETVTSGVGPNISITKSISPVPVADGATVTYTFVIENTGNRALVATDNAVIRDLFDPILTDVTATFNGVAWTEGTEYNYNQATGLFESVPSNITVPSATYTRDPVSGVVSLIPGTSTLVITGTI
jgi:hypothetical protein